MKMFSVSDKPIKTIQFFQDHGHPPHLCRSGCNWRSGFTEKSPEVKWGHNPFFVNKSRQDRDRDAQMVPNDLARWATSEDVHIDLLGSWSDLTWGQIFKLAFQGPKVHVSNWLDEANTTLSFSFSYLPYQKSYQWKSISVKQDNFLFDDLWNQNYWPSVKYGRKKLPGHEESSPMLFSEFLLAIILSEIVLFAKKSIFSRNLILGDLWWPQYWSDLKMTFLKFEISPRYILRRLPLVAK